MTNPLSPSDFPWPPVDEDIRAALEAAYQDGSWGRYHGPHGVGLCEDLRNFFACDHVLLCSSGTIAVELALRGCGVQSGDEVVLAGYDFPGNFRAIEAVGARPVLVDVDPDTWSLDVEKLAGELSHNDCDRIRAVVVSHLHGGLAHMPAIMALARQHGWHVVEDACQQPGAKLDGRMVGTWGDVGVLSFGGSKLLTAGRGGALVTDDPAIHQRAKIFAQRGNDAFPLSELQAAVLRPQLAKLHKRNRIRADRVAAILDGVGPIAPWLRAAASRSQSQAAYFKLAWSYLPAEDNAQRREQLLAALAAEGVPVDAGFRGFTRRSESRCRQIGSLENSGRLSRSTILLHHPILLAKKETALQAAAALTHVVDRLAT